MQNIMFIENNMLAYHFYVAVTRDETATRKTLF